jgi:hypothetical protein
MISAALRLYATVEFSIYALMTPGSTFDSTIFRTSATPAEKLTAASGAALVAKGAGGGAGVGAEYSAAEESAKAPMAFVVKTVIVQPMSHRAVTLLFRFERFISTSTMKFKNQYIIIIELSLV